MGKRVTKQYDVEFKLGAVELIEQQGYSVPAAGRKQAPEDGNRDLKKSVMVASHHPER